MKDFNTNVVQVIPLNDISEHDESYTRQMGIPVSKCACMPKVNLDIESGGWIIVHGAFDGREAVEEFNNIINNG